MPRVDAPPRPAGPWTRVDARARLMATCVVSGAALAAAAPPALLLPAGALAALLAASRTAPGFALAALRPFRFLLAFTVLLQLLLVPGEPLLPAGPAVPSRPGLAAALLVLARLAAVIVASAHLVATTPAGDLARALGWLLAPLERLRLPVRDAELVLALGLRFVPALREEGRQVRSALESRGISLHDPRARRRLRALLVWLLAVLFGMVERSGRLATALAVRGFALPGRARRRFPPWNRESLAAVIASVLVALGSLVAR